MLYGMNPSHLDLFLAATAPRSSACGCCGCSARRCSPCGSGLVRVQSDERHLFPSGRSTMAVQLGDARHAVRSSCACSPAIAISSPCSSSTMPCNSNAVLLVYVCGCKTTNGCMCVYEHRRRRKTKCARVVWLALSCSTLFLFCAVGLFVKKIQRMLVGHMQIGRAHV